MRERESIMVAGYFMVAAYFMMVRGREMDKQPEIWGIRYSIHGHVFDGLCSPTMPDFQIRTAAPNNTILL